MINKSGFSIHDKNYPSYAIFFIVILFTAALLITNALPINGEKYFMNSAQAGITGLGSQEYHVYLPIIYNVNYSVVPKVNIPKIENDQGEFLPEGAAIFWFGNVTPIENYADVRIGYVQSNLWVRISVFDRRLWYDPSPTIEELTNWDAASLFLNVDGNISNITNDNTYRFDAQMNWWEDRDNWQVAYRVSNEGWSIEPIYFLTNSRWWGFPQPNDNLDDRAWAIEYTIPFESLGFAGTPPEGTEWRLGFQMHDRDDFARTLIPDKVWPTNMLPDFPTTWGIIHFGLPDYSPPQVSNPQTYTLQNGLNGITVTDGMVGGDTVCGDGLDFWSEWGNYSYPGSRHLNVQNQGNTDDWPCFSKIYITFPLDSIPREMEVITSTLTLHQLGNSTGFPYDPPKALNSLIQVWEINQVWYPATLSWNNSPQPIENLSRAWVGSIEMPDLGIARTWDVSLAAARAYNAGEPLRLVLYSADFYGGHGKYFFSSSSTDWDGDWRPILDITLGNP